MQAILLAAYPWTKALHILAMVAWMAGLFYLPRIFVYHAESAATGSQTSQVFKTMEKKLLRFIMTPAMIVTWSFGILLVITPGAVDWGSDGWIYVKLAAVVLLTWFHHWLGLRCQDFAADRNRISGRRYRLMNELPSLALVVIVIMVVVKPF